MPQRHHPLPEAGLPKSNPNGNSDPSASLRTRTTEDSLTPDASVWRSSASYDHVEELTASGLAWEWLRRNEAYDKDFEAVIHDDPDPTPLTDTIQQRWGLRFPGGPTRACANSARLLATAARHQRRCPRFCSGRADTGSRRPSGSFGCPVDCRWARLSRST
ncbi:DUF6499 domain-containing protein [Xanthobacter sp. V2C-8]|uniref:transcriptional regulator domain-containing protein n=1 Tax=Xanthobacter albus TaxID=3119929 RepID=UPI00372BB94E